MSAELELRWLKAGKTKGAARRFAEFCKDDIKQQSKLDNFDLDKYQSAVKLVMRKLDNSDSVKELFSLKEEIKEDVINVD